MAAVSTMILRSMRMIGEKERGGTLTTAEQTETLAEFNTFLEATALERLLCYQVTEDTLALTASTNSYTIGTNGAFAVTRPVKIVDPCFVRDAAGYDSPITVIGAEEYGKLKFKSAGYTYPNYLFYDQGFGATSTGTIYLYPAPTAGLTLHINSWKQLGTVSTQSQNLSLPPGYQLFIESNFALHLAGGFTPVSPETLKIARESKAAIKGANAISPAMRLDAGALPYRRFGNIITGP